MFISFIAPAYKIEKYLTDFFNSFSNFDKEKFEIIIVNDEVGKDLTIWKNKYDYNIKIHDNDTNIGQGPSRLKGIELIDANTTNVMMIDPDDKINENFRLDDLNVNEITQFGYCEWYKNKKILRTPNGDVGKYELDNHIWGISFPVNTAKKIFEYSRLGESNDMPIKLRMSNDFVFNKSDIPLVDYRIRKTSTINSVRSERRAKEELQTWINLMDEGYVNAKKANDNIYFELIINKKSFEKEWYKNKINKYKPNTSFLNRFNAIMYRTVKFWWLKNKLKNIFSFRRMFD